VIIPYDHASFSGPVAGLQDPVALTERIARSGADGILVTPGILKSIAPVVGDLGIMLRIDGAFTKYAAGPTDYQPMYTVQQAMTLGADAVIVFTFIRTPAEPESMRRLGQTSAEADTLGMPMVAEILAPDLLNNHFNTTIFGKGERKPDLVAQTMDMVRLGAEAGADVVKTRYVGSVEQFREVVRCSPAKVIVAGGPPMKLTDENFLRLTANTVAAGAHGVIIGRNVWQHPKMEQMIAAMCAIVHDGSTVESALTLLR
jgi:DhnA family fructose-bisphosphate aldolase class Ia